jgi:energy-coupling factor transporter ATP-binding protein EcfA2
MFCEDFLRLLHHNQKRHKQKVPCLIGEADSGKTSLFYPLFGLIHHTNIATITKQKAFNKSMINKFTEVIFIDEASVSMMDIDDWKILTQGIYTY